MFALTLLHWSPVTLTADQSQWQLEAYGGRYYDADRTALYGAYTQPVVEELSFSLEVLYEKVDAYKFRGFGGHLLWEVSEGARFGVVGSLGEEYYPFETYAGDTLIGRSEAWFELSTIGLEAELNPGSFTIAAQAGKIFSRDYEDAERDYTSIDAYYWGPDKDWYFRGADQRAGNDALTFVEVYRNWFSAQLPTTLYFGTSTGQYESIYAGAYLELINDQNTNWYIDAGFGHSDDEWQVQFELYLLIGPGTDIPLLSAFGFSIGD